MARHYAGHDFLVQEGLNPELHPRETVASILVNQGTTPNVVVREALDWIERNAASGPFHITWFSPGALVPATLLDFRSRRPHHSAATHVFLFPGTVDLQTQAVSGSEAETFAKSITRHFSYVLLSGHSFNLATGDVSFHFEKEIPLQRACALLRATQKFLFFDSKKFTGEGQVGYSLAELLETSEAVTLYTVSSDNDRRIRAAFSELAEHFLDKSVSVPLELSNPGKTLRLVIVGQRSRPTDTANYRGILRPISRPRT